MKNIIYLNGRVGKEKERNAEEKERKEKEGRKDRNNVVIISV
jgi:hypothetical protein